MQVVRTVVESNRLETIVEIPEELKNQRVELLIMPLLEAPPIPPHKKKTFNPDEYVGLLDMDEQDIENELKSLRDEWERF